MSVQEYDCTTRLPYPVLRWVRAFGPRMRGGLVRALQMRQAAKGTLSVQDFCECIETAWAMIEADVEYRVEFPAPDETQASLARQAAIENRGSTIDEILNALP